MKRKSLILCTFKKELDDSFPEKITKHQYELNCNFTLVAVGYIDSFSKGTIDHEVELLLIKKTLIVENKIVNPEGYKSTSLLNHDFLIEHQRKFKIELLRHYSIKFKTTRRGKEVIAPGFFELEVLGKSIGQYKSLWCCAKKVFEIHEIKISK